MMFRIFFQKSFGPLSNAPQETFLDVEETKLLHEVRCRFNDIQAGRARVTTLPDLAEVPIEIITLLYPELLPPPKKRKAPLNISLSNSPSHIAAEWARVNSKDHNDPPR